MSIGTILALLVLLLVSGKAWRFFTETSDDLQLIRLLEPWFWFLFMNLALSFITSQYDYPFVVVGAFLQIALSAWFGISTGWIVQNCKHPMAVFNQSWFVRGKIVKYCYRCGTRVVPDRHDHAIRSDSWIMTLFQHALRNPAACGPASINSANASLARTCTMNVVYTRLSVCQRTNAVALPQLNTLWIQALPESGSPPPSAAGTRAGRTAGLLLSGAQRCRPGWSRIPPSSPSW